MVRLGCTSICVLIAHLLKLVLWPISDMLIIDVSRESGHGTAAHGTGTFKEASQGQRNSRNIDLVCAWAGAPVPSN